MTKAWRTVTVVIADAQVDVRAALGLLITHELEMRIVGEAADADSLWPLLDTTFPDLLLLDWGLVDGEGATAVARLRSGYPDLRILILGGVSAAESAARGFGTDGFISKADGPERVLSALRTAQAQTDQDRQDGSP
jgi:DNA-binding NarL/FixJ family response regulator